MVDTYYCGIFTDYHDVGGYSPGVYRFEDDNNWSWPAHAKLISQSQWIIKETENRVVWIKHRFKSAPDHLDQDDLKQFIWDKLKAQHI